MTYDDRLPRLLRLAKRVLGRRLGQSTELRFSARGDFGIEVLLRIGTDASGLQPTGHGNNGITISVDVFRREAPVVIIVMGSSGAVGSSGNTNGSLFGIGGNGGEPGNVLLSLSMKSAAIVFPGNGAEGGVGRRFANGSVGFGGKGGNWAGGNFVSIDLPLVQPVFGAVAFGPDVHVESSTTGLTSRGDPELQIFGSGGVGGEGGFGAVANPAGDGGIGGVGVSVHVEIDVREPRRPTDTTSGRGRVRAGGGGAGGTGGFGNPPGRSGDGGAGGNLTFDHAFIEGDAGGPSIPGFGGAPGIPGRGPGGALGQTGDRGAEGTRTVIVD